MPIYAKERDYPYTFPHTHIYIQDILTNYYTLQAIGVLTYFYLCGRTPFQGRSQNETIDNIERHKKLIFRGQRWHNISKEATEFIQSLLTPNPKKR